MGYAIAVYTSDLEYPFAERPVRFWGDERIYVWHNEADAIEYMNTELSDWGQSSDLEEGENLDDLVVVPVHLNIQEGE